MVACAFPMLALATVALVSVLLHMLSSYSRLKAIPGPILASVSDLWRATAQRSSEYGYARYLVELHRVYGDVVRLGPEVVCLRDVEDITGVLSEVCPQSQTLSAQIPVSQYERAYEESMRNLVQTIRQHIIIDMTTSLRFFADEMMIRFFPEPTTQPARARTQAQPTSSLFVTIEELLLRGPVSLLKRERFACYSSANTRSAWRDGTDPLPAQGPNKTPDGSQEYILTTSIDILKATFTSVIHFLLHNPQNLTHLRREIDNTPRFWDGELMPYRQDLIGMSYLDAVLKETMRLILLRYPIQELRTEAESIYVSSTHIPPGTTISYHPYVLLTNVSLFGPKTEVFRPERWLTTDREKRIRMEKSLLPVSAGLTSYPELENAWVALKRVVVVLLREFEDIRLLQTKEGHAGSELKMTADSISPPSTLVEFRPRLRRSMKGIGYSGQIG
ncbi:hypothetical protein BDV12DRAFT_170358 [Aspergillus spectabilis]